MGGIIPYSIVMVKVLLHCAYMVQEGVGMYIHFTSKEHADIIVGMMLLLPCSYLGSMTEGYAPVYAVSVDNGEYVPGTQQPGFGRTAERDYAVIFTTDDEPVWEEIEETVWDVPENDGLVLTDAAVVTAEDAISLLKKGEYSYPF